MICKYKDCDIPVWLRFPNIVHGYRYGGDKISCLKSLFMWHNETINAWTMILLNCISLYCFFMNSYRKDVTPYAILTLSSISHLPFSLGYHLFMPISQEVLMKWRERDMVMVLVSICMQTYALNYFIIEKVISNFILMLNVSMVFDIIEKKEAISDKCIYMKHVLGNILPLTFFLFIPIMYSGNTFFIYSFLFCGITGGVVYLKQFPEKYLLGKFDYLGSSHQIMHIFLIFIHLLQYKFVEFYDSNIYIN